MVSRVDVKWDNGVYVVTVKRGEETLMSVSQNMTDRDHIIFEIPANLFSEKIKGGFE